MIFDINWIKTVLGIKPKKTPEEAKKALVNSFGTPAKDKSPCGGMAGAGAIAPPGYFRKPSTDTYEASRDSTSDNLALNVGLATLAAHIVSQPSQETYEAPAPCPQPDRYNAYSESTYSCPAPSPSYTSDSSSYTSSSSYSSSDSSTSGSDSYSSSSSWD